MKEDWSKAERFRVADAPGYETAPGNRFGIFSVPMNGIRLLCMVSSGDDLVPWEHVSVSAGKRVPNWYEMQLIKDMFWAADETVMQLHVAAERHINLHQHTLHLWRPLKATIPLPPQIAV